MAITSGQVTVGTTAIQVDGTSNSNYWLHIHNADNQENLYIGGPDVTITTGLILPKQDSTEIMIPPGDAIWIVSSSSDHLVSWLKVS